MRTMIPLAALLPLALAGCAGMMGGDTHDQAAAARSSGGGAFGQALAREYTLFADSEASQSDWIDTWTFRQKARMAASGQIPAPEDPARRDIGTGLQLNPDTDIGPEQRAEAIQARPRLLAALSGAQRNPDAAARAQVAYDCWVEQLEEGWQRDHIERCRRAFNAAMGELEARPVAAVVAPGERLQVYFPLDSAQLTPESRQAIASVAEDINRQTRLRVTVDGYADRSGPDAYNDRLSEQRAEAVKRELVAAGVPAGRVQTRAHGERDLAVPTPDGTVQPENRRTVIEFD
jgi:OOP family OmpA-OmpF porin